MSASVTGGGFSRSWAWALDGSYFQPAIGAQTIAASAGTTVNIAKADLKVGTVAGELMLRLPLGFF